MFRFMIEIEINIDLSELKNLFEVFKLPQAILRLSP
ncbi:unnamed protein product, partial [marine sediment metagenome]